MCGSRIFAGLRVGWLLERLLLFGSTHGWENLGLNLHLHPGGDSPLLSARRIQLRCLRGSRVHPKVLPLLTGHLRCCL